MKPRIVRAFVYLTACAGLSALGAWAVYALAWIARALGFDVRIEAADFFILIGFFTLGSALVVGLDRAGLLRRKF